jgi:hypothetical protein
MTSMRYEERLRAFAEGKRLRRFRGMLRNPKDSTCDACGSVMPHNLWGLRDMETGQDYFLGQSCLGNLSKMLVIERPFVRANLQTCYERTRGEGVTTGSGNGAQADAAGSSRAPARDGEKPVAPTNGHSADIQVVENDEFVTVFVRAASPCGRHQAWGTASEPGYRQVWRLDPSSPPVLRPTTELNPDAVAVCLKRAQHAAQQELEAALAAIRSTAPAQHS